MRQIWDLFRILFFLLPGVSAYAQQVQITAINLPSQTPDRLEFTASGEIHQKVFTLSGPDRLVVDFFNTNLQSGTVIPAENHPLIAKIRTAVRNSHDLRVVFELKSNVDFKTRLNGASLIIDLQAKDKPIVLQEKTIKQSEKLSVHLEKSFPKPEKIKAVTTVLKNDKILDGSITHKPELLKTVKPRGRDIVIAIDAGHGGKDVGAQGNNGVQEKDVVFAIAKKLEGIVSRQAGMRAVMIRNGDYFVPLNERVRMAHEAKADLFVSIHADAYHDPSAHGASVYTLAKKGASSSDARWLAENENAADFYALKGQDFKDDALSSVLKDLSKSAAKEASQNIGVHVLKSVKSVSHLHRSSVQRAGFVVLKSPDIPSILVETAFISNPDEEYRLTTNAYQDRMASAVFGGIMAHFKQYAPANTYLAQLSKSGKKLTLAAGSRQEDKPLLLTKAENIEHLVK
jgi:N-acetylmuramoyl-L-alanine amidase